jgi:hypothetical protein
MPLLKSRASLLLFSLLGSVPLSALSAAPLPVAPLACDTTKGACWQPAPDEHWQYQLQGTAGMADSGYINVNLSAVPFTGGAPVKPSVFDIDLYQDEAFAGNASTVNTAAVEAIHQAGGKAICYISAGTWENWRPDASKFPDNLLGKKNGWPGERWLDIRQTSLLLPLMEERLKKCVTTGFDSVEWDNVDGYSNRTGFPLTAADQTNYNALLANLAHSHGLSAALKNSVELVPALASYFDYAINEECQRYKECTAYSGHFLPARTVFQVEYSGTLSSICTSANQAGRNAIKKNLDLYDTPYASCR